jgi:hypothetical protein
MSSRGPPYQDEPDTRVSGIEFSVIPGGLSGVEPKVGTAWSPSAGGTRRRLPELDALIDRLTRLRATVADCLACGCLSLTTCAVLSADTDEHAV